MKFAPSQATTFVQALAVIALTAGVVACQPAPNGSSQSQATPPAGQAPMVEGGSSGGGGYVSENSALLLEQSSQKLASMIRKSTPAIYGDLPNGWSPARLALIIEKVRSSPDKDLRRDGKDLMFNYAVETDGTEYIEALKPFFHVYGAVPVKMQTQEQLRDLQNDLMLKLMHETAHHMKLDEKGAEAFAYDKLLEMDLDIYSCISEAAVKFSPPDIARVATRLESGVSIRRSTGEAFRLDSNGFVATQPIDSDGYAFFQTPVPGASTTPSPRVFAKPERKIGDYVRKLEAYAAMNAIYSRPTVTADASTSGPRFKVESKYLGLAYWNEDTGHFDSSVVDIAFGTNEKNQFVEAATVTTTGTQKKIAEDGTSTTEPLQQTADLTCRWRSELLITIPAKKTP